MACNVCNADVSAKVSTDANADAVQMMLMLMMLMLMLMLMLMGAMLLVLMLMLVQCGVMHAEEREAESASRKGDDAMRQVGCSSKLAQ